MLNTTVYNPFIKPGDVPAIPGTMTATGVPAVPTVQQAPPMSTPTPPSLVQPVNPPTTAPTYQLPGAAGFTPANVVANTMDQIVDGNGRYIQNARRRGLETAASRGIINSNMAAGAAERSALEAAQPMLGEAMGLGRQRESNAFQGEQNQLDRNQQYTMAQVEDWANSRQFNREFYGALSMMPINNAYQLNGLIMNYALDNPEVYTANVVSGMSNFFAQNFQQILGTYFPDIYGGGP